MVSCLKPVEPPCLRSAVAIDKSSRRHPPHRNCVPKVWGGCRRSRSACFSMLAPIRYGVALYALRHGGCHLHGRWVLRSAERWAGMPRLVNGGPSTSPSGWVRMGVSGPRSLYRRSPGRYFRGGHCFSRRHCEDSIQASCPQPLPARRREVPPPLPILQRALTGG